MSLLKDLIENVENRDEQLRDITIGPLWTLATSSTCGIAATPPGRDRSAEEKAHELCDKKIGDLIELCLSHDPYEVSVGIAALNSALIGQIDLAHYKPKRIPTARDRNVVVVGESRFADELRNVARQVYVIEDPSEDPGKTESTARDLLPEADIVLVSGSTLPDDLLERLLELSKPIYTVVYGPSTPLSPILFSYGANQLVGTTVVDRERAKGCVIAGIRDLAQCPGMASVVLVPRQQSI